MPRRRNGLVEPVPIVEIPAAPEPAPPVIIPRNRNRGVYNTDFESIHFQRLEQNNRTRPEPYFIPAVQLHADDYLEIPAAPPNIPYIPLHIGIPELPELPDLLNNPPVRELSFKKISTKTRVSKMRFEDLDETSKIEYMKREFNYLVKFIFDNPEGLKALVVEKKLSKEQAKLIFKNINCLNSSTCLCCRRFDQKLLKKPIEPELEPLIDLAQATAKSKSY